MRTERRKKKKRGKGEEEGRKKSQEGRKGSEKERQRRKGVWSWRECDGSDHITVLYIGCPSEAVVRDEYNRLIQNLRMLVKLYWRSYDVRRHNCPSYFLI